MEDIAIAITSQDHETASRTHGSGTYYLKFIKSFAKIAAQLKRHLKNRDKNLLLSDNACEAFEKFKRELTNMGNMLALPDFEMQFVLVKDASDNCIGAA